MFSDLILSEKTRKNLNKLEVCLFNLNKITKQKDVECEH